MKTTTNKTDLFLVEKTPLGSFLRDTCAVAERLHVDESNRTALSFEDRRALALFRVYGTIAKGYFLRDAFGCA
jgi:hypothetical protein